MDTYCLKVISIQKKCFINFTFDAIAKNDKFALVQMLSRIKQLTRYGKSSLIYFIPKFINEISRYSYNQSFSEFESFIYSNLDIKYESFINKFDYFF